MATKPEHLKMEISQIHKPVPLILLLQITIILSVSPSPLLISCSLTNNVILPQDLHGDDELISSSWPDPSPLPAGFLFGTASSSYQFEGAYMADGKGLSNWDVYSHKQGNVIADGSNGDVAVDHYHRYLEDVGLMEKLGVNSYRFSISWSRILPKGRFGRINMAGIDYYNKLIDILLSTGIQPFVTLNHFDIPQELEDRYGGWLSPLSREDFRYFADTCFKYFGGRVKHWVTFNEPNLHTILGYRKGLFPPCRCSTPFGNCTAGDSDEEPFVVAHNLILSHAAAVATYRKNYQKQQKGTTGIVIHASWFEPINNSTEDKLAAQRALSFFMNWFLDPIIFGRYPEEMVEILGDALPEFSLMEQGKLQKSRLDFIGINYYTSYYVQDCIFSDCDDPGLGTTRTEGYYRQSSDRNGDPIGQPTDLIWQNVFPEGMEKMVTYVKERYNNTPMYITENGYGELEDEKRGKNVSLRDVKRTEYMASHLNSLIEAVRKGADVRGYFAWSLLDNFEWNYGYTVRFGLHYVDYKTMKRTPKLSASWFRKFIAKHKKIKTVTSANNSDKI